MQASNERDWVFTAAHLHVVHVVELLGAARRLAVVAARVAAAEVGRVGQVDDHEGGARRVIDDDLVYLSAAARGNQVAWRW